MHRLQITERRDPKLKISYVIKTFFILFILVILPASSFEAASSAKPEQSVGAKVIEMLPSAGNAISNNVKVKITSGKHKNQILTVPNLVNESDKDVNILAMFNLHKGDEVLLNIEENEDGTIKNAYIYDYVRYKYVAIVALLFITLVVLVGGKKGVKSLITLLLTGAAIIKIIIPLIMKGIDPVLPTIVICVVLLVANILIINGLNKKALAAILGAASGLLCSGLLVLTVGNAARLTGLSTEDAQALSYIPMNHAFHFKGLFFAGILLGALGAVMDISITIASAMSEVENNNLNITKKEFIKSGMNVGRDILGAMTNTLILAYMSAALVILLLLSSFDLSFIEIINQDVIASEIFKALAGSIGLIFTIPATAFTAAHFKEYTTRSH